MSKILFILRMPVAAVFTVVFVAVSPLILLMTERDDWGEVLPCMGDIIKGFWTGRMR